MAVMGHVGLTPQAISVLGGFRPAAQSAAEALRVVREAKALEAAGCFAIVLECVPEMVAAAVTRELSVPTIGIGAGGHTSGQVTPRWTRRAALLCRCLLAARLCPPVQPRSNAPCLHTWPPSPPNRIHAAITTHARCWCTTTCWA